MGSGVHLRVLNSLISFKQAENSVQSNHIMHDIS